MARQGAGIEMPFGWMAVSDTALQRLRSELEERGQGVVDEMGVLAIHSGYADYFFPGTSVLQTRPRYLFFVCWNFLWLARQKGVTATNLARRKDEADLWVTRQLVATANDNLRSVADSSMDGIIGVRLFQEEPPRLPAQRPDFVYWTALRKWSLFRGRIDRTRFLRRWRGSMVRRLGEGPDQVRDDAIDPDVWAELAVPPVPDYWQKDEHGGLDFELAHEEAQSLQQRLTALDGVVEGSCLLATAAELCADIAPRMIAADEPGLGPWDDPLILQAAKACGQRDRIDRAFQASQLAYYVRAIYAALVEWIVEETDSTRRGPPLRHYRELLGELCAEPGVRDPALALSLAELRADLPRIPDALMRCLENVQQGLRRIAAGAEAESVFMDSTTHRLFETVERRRKGGRARLPRTEQAAARRVGFDAKTLSVYDLDYRWNRVRYLLWDLHRGLGRG